jgi:hypothetical protein
MTETPDFPASFNVQIVFSRNDGELRWNGHMKLAL